MCGIVGVAGVRPIRDQSVLQAQCCTLRHRGPDDAGLWWSSGGNVGLGHQRLSILDLSPAGKQPMSDAAGIRHVVFNGEIYNFAALREELKKKGYKFRSTGDTEVLLTAYIEWGTECVSRLTGMFAFAIYDDDRKTIFAARDRVGEKPFFYRNSSEGFAFASELKALLADDNSPRNLDLDSLEFYLALGYVPFDHCILQGYKKLPPAHALLFDVPTGRLRIWRYWDLPEPIEASHYDPAVLLEELESLLFDSVKAQLVADVPVGVLLSGGIDSSLVTALAAKAELGPVKTFTISFPGHGAYDEGPHARLVADHFHTEHINLVAEPATVSLLPKLARQFDEPLGDSSMVPTYLVTKLVREHCTVALGGDGGDELFGGYPQYNLLLRQQELYSSLPQVVRRAIAKGSSYLPIGLRGRTYGLSLGANKENGLAYGSLYFDCDSRRRLLGISELKPRLAPESFRVHAGGTSTSAIQRMTRADFRSYLPDDILVKVDRAGMMNSLEVRAPFLDPRVIAFAFGKLPDSSRATRSSKKILLRQLAGKLLPQGLDLERKQGFSLPLGSWFRGQWGAYIEETLLSSQSSLFDKRAVRSMIVGQRYGLSNAQRLFNLAFFELWRREYRVGAPC